MSQRNAVSTLFSDQFSKPCDVDVFAPGRINLMGEHTDYNEGLVLPIALPIGIDLAIGIADKPGLHAYSDLFDKVSTRALSDPANEDWTDYILAACSVFPGTLPDGLNVAVQSSLPHGASVSSSAALLVATLRGLRALLDVELDDDTLARLAQRAENEFVGVQCGLMDQMVSSRGAQNAAMLFDTMTGDIENVSLIQGTALVTLHSGQTRKLQGNAYNDRRLSCEQAARDLGVESLRHASLADLSKVQDDDARAKARHVISDNARVLSAIEAIKLGDAAALGSLINECHASLRDDFDVSTPAMDDMVAFCQANGALGARMTGAGFGGCIIMLTSGENAEAITQKVQTEFAQSWHVNTMVF